MRIWCLRPLRYTWTVTVYRLKRAFKIKCISSNYDSLQWLLFYAWSSLWCSDSNAEWFYFNQVSNLSSALISLSCDFVSWLHKKHDVVSSSVNKFETFALHEWKGRMTIRLVLILKFISRTTWFSTILSGPRLDILYLWYYFAAVSPARRLRQAIVLTYGKVWQILTVVQKSRNLSKNTINYIMNGLLAACDIIYHTHGVRLWEPHNVPNHSWVAAASTNCNELNKLSQRESTQHLSNRLSLFHCPHEILWL